MARWGVEPHQPPGHAVEIDAPPEHVWPWLAQMGQDRGGFYSYEWLENLAGCRMCNADAVRPEWQHRHARGEPPAGAAKAFYALLVDIPHFVMERRMLLGIKERAESASKAS